MNTCPKCEKKSIVVRALAPVEFTIYPRRDTDTIAPHTGRTVEGKPDLFSPVYYCTACGEVFEIRDSLFWFGTDEPVQATGG